MRRSFITLFLFLCVFCHRASAIEVAAGPAQRKPDSIGSPLMVFAHSHNDYEHQHPLLDALANRFYSVEADIFLSGDDLVVSHLGFLVKGTLRELYLDPLQKLVETQGSVYGDGRPFYLWIDIKSGDPQLRKVLHDTLENYSMLSVFTDKSVEQRPVTVILTGDENNKTKYMTDYPVRRACRDSNSFKIEDPKAGHRWLWYSLEWSDYFKWDGYGKIPELDRERLKLMVDAIHRGGRKVRFWASPETEAFWGAALAANVDLIGTDFLKRVHTFLLHFSLKKTLGL